MKYIKIAILSCIFNLISTHCVLAGYTFYETSGEVDLTEFYRSNRTEIWYIHSGVNKPIIFSGCVDLEEDMDFAYIYALDENNKEYLIQTITGCHCWTFSTYLPTGKAKVVLVTNDYGDVDTGYSGGKLYYQVDNSYNGTNTSNFNVTNNFTTVRL